MTNLKKQITTSSMSPPEASPLRLTHRRSMIDLADEDLDSRIISFLNQSPVGDGGQWDMAVNILGQSHLPFYTDCR